LLFFANYSFAAQEFHINFDYPSFEGDFYVSGKVSFPPSSVRSERNISVRVTDRGDEISTKIVISNTWPDGSVQGAQIIFAANSTTKYSYTLFFGEDVVRKKSFNETAVLPSISFSVGGAPMMVEQVDVSVGQINVMVDKSPSIYYYWNIIPIILLIVLTYYRSRKARGV
jgi:hypothetical protein